MSTSPPPPTELPGLYYPPLLIQWDLCYEDLYGKRPGIKKCKPEFKPDAAWEVCCYCSSECRPIAIVGTELRCGLCFMHCLTEWIEEKSKVMAFSKLSPHEAVFKVLETIKKGQPEANGRFDLMSFFVMWNCIFFTYWEINRGE